ncbi:fibronectin type III domain-containing protein [Flavobacterium sp. PL02]|uniref:fibronectin type III domain-containing protein n=1 Tax=Flavobacterium sp. PL02 TaxID=3088354 RepID=UPI002B224C2B|nr:fibronectin type III domain-containing protein [Flavobacterium sp. PL02]MEA9412196.1 fibronectin type III domain-containing protein [Flavobacterium sp. PL02]
MKNFFKNIILFTLFCSPLGGWGAYAQLFPVQLTPVFNSPYSIKLSDYATSMDTKMRLLINPTDISISQRQVRLKLYIQGNGLNIQTSDYMVGQRPIFINGGELQTLTNTDIGALFRLENLQGITALQYANGLPEGMYSFCFEMFDYMTNQRISQKSCASLYLILNDPPLLNTPQKNEQIASSDFPNIMFTWTPRQMNATNISYKFELKQLIDPTLDPQFAFQMSPLLYEETLFGTALLYNLSMPILTPGMRYAWRVRAISTTGLSENAVFKNDGYSEIYSFKYTASCAAPTFLLSESQSSKSVKITWEGIPEHTRYQVQYKKQNVRNAQWFSINSLNTQSLITNLEPGLTYQFRVGSSCDPATDGVQSFTYSGISTFTTPTETSGVPAYNCGIIPQINIQNQKPLTNLIQSETFKAGDFPVTILELKGENSPYSGRGYIIVPYLKDTKIAVEFNNIVVNTDYQLISGIVETSYNPEWKNVTDVEDFTGEGQGGQIEETVPFEIKDIIINPNGDIVVNGNDGQQVTIPGGKDTVITDSKGNTYTVDKDGNGSNEPTEPAAGGKPTPENTDGVDKSGQATAFTAKGISIAFSGNDSKYAFDVMPIEPPAALEKLYKKVGNVALPYKAVLNGYTDTMLATVTVTDTNIKLDSIVFKNQNGAKIQADRNDKVFVLTVKGKLSYAEDQILATIKQGDKWKVIGAFMLVHISPKNVNVALVPTDNTSKYRLDEVIANTQAIYNKVGVKINFKKEEVLEDFDRVVPGKTIQTERNSLTSTYSAEQQNINALYHDADNSYVLFITNKPSSTGQDGYMRLNGQFGYVFPSRTEAVRLKTPAHELGHGIFKLQHPFEQYKTSESGTDLLMDYSEGTILNHQDWKQINDPAFKLYAFQSQESGQLAGGFGIAPNWSFVNNGDETTVAYLEVAEKGFVGGFKNGKKTYKWDATNKVYVNDADKKDVFELPTSKPTLKESIIWLIFDNDKSITQHKYLKTIYNEELKVVLDSKVPEKLSAFIDKYATKDNFRREKEDRTTFWGYVACNGCNYDGDGNGTDVSYVNYVENLGKLANKGYKNDPVDVNAAESHVYDYSAIITEKEKNKILSEMAGIKTDSGIATKIFLTDTQTLPAKRKEVTDYLASVKGLEIALWIDFDAKGKATIKTVLGDKTEGKGSTEMNKYLQLLGEVLPKFDGKYTAFNPLTAMLDGLAGLIGKLAIPDRFYNPDATDYNSFPAEVYSYVSLSIAKDKINTVIGNPIYTDKYSASRSDFAFTCGVWNGFIGVVEALPAGASMIIKIPGGIFSLIVNEDGAREKFSENISKLSWDGIRTMIGDEWRKSTANPCMVHYTSGEVVFVIASCFIGAGEIKGASAFFQTLEKLDAVGQAIGKFAKFSSPYVRAAINKTGRFVIAPLVKLEPEISIKLRQFLTKSFNNIIKKSEKQLLVNLHATDGGKFLVDGLELSPEELGELLSKKLSKDQEIILLSCNDLASAKALSEATGKTVYTTEGSITIYKDGIKRAEGTDWYRVEPNGSAVKVGSPVNECPGCKGSDGVVMGAGFNLRKYLTNISDDLANKIENLIPWIKNVDINIGKVEEEMVDNIRIIKVVKDKSKIDRAYNIVRNEMEAENYLLKKFNAQYFETKYITDRHTGKQLELKVYLTGKDGSHVLLVRKDLPDVAENLVGGGVNKEHFNFGEFPIDKYDDINLENNKLHEHVIWTD